jgi:hypothetical protein
MPATIERPRTPLVVSNTRISAGPASKKLSRGASNDELLDAYLEFVRSMRNTQGAVRLRDADLEVLSAVIGWTPDQIRADLDQRMHAVRVEKRRRQSRRAVFAACGISVIASTLVLVSGSGPSTAVAAAPKVGTAMSIERTADSHIVELHEGTQSVGTVTLGDAQVVTRE